MNSMETKVCSKCGKELPLSEFNKCKKSPDGLDYWCRDCQKQYHIENAERIKKRQKEYYQEHKEEMANYRLEHREERNQYMREWHDSHKEHEENYRIEHREERLEYNKQYNKDYYEANKEKESERKKQYYNTLRGWSNAIVKHCIEADLKAKRIEVELPKDYVDVEWTMEQIQKGCAHKDICGTTDWKEVGLNRIDNSLSHVKSNCEPCCWECNHRLNAEDLSTPIIEIKDDGTTVEYGSIRKCFKSHGKSSGLYDAINGKNDHYYKTSQFYKKEEYNKKLLEELTS